MKFFTAGKFILVQFLALLLVGICQAQDERRVISAMAPMTKSLGGAKAADVFLNTKVRVLESKGDWVLVQAEGWMRSSALSGPSSSSAASAPPPLSAPSIVQDVLEVLDYVGSHRTDINPARYYLILTLRNKGQSLISDWKGLLVGQDQDGKIILRQSISQDSVKIEAGAKSEANFYWEPSEEVYQTLLEHSKNKLRLSLVEVVINE